MQTSPIDETQATVEDLEDLVSDLLALGVPPGKILDVVCEAIADWGNET